MHPKEAVSFIRDLPEVDSLVIGCETPAQVRRRRFGNVDGSDDACDTDAHAANDTPHDKVRNAKGKARTDGAYEK